MQPNKKAKVLFLGSKKIGYDCLKALYSADSESIVDVITTRDISDRRSYFIKIAKFCSNFGIKMYIANSKKHSEEIIKELKPDICFVVCWYWLISKEILDSISKGTFGIHHSLLPKYRGSSPLVWSIINGEKYVGSSLFKISAGMDVGPIVFQHSIELKQSDYISDVLNVLETEMAAAIGKNYKSMINDPVLELQDHTKATYCARRIPEDGKIDFNKSNLQVYNFIRAQSFPYPGAYVIYRGFKLIILKISITDINYYGTVGQVAKIDEKGVWIICGNNKPIIFKTVYWKDKETNVKDIEISFNDRF